MLFAIGRELRKLGISPARDGLAYRDIEIYRGYIRGSN